MKIKMWNIEEFNGYKPITTFWEDFSIADKFGIDAVKDTFNRAFNQFKTDYKYLTELSLVLNWKIWEHHEKGNNELAKLYDWYWRRVDNYAYENLNDEEKSYYWEKTD
jgi:hypothetical protein